MKVVLPRFTGSIIGVVALLGVAASLFLLAKESYETTVVMHRGHKITFAPSSEVEWRDLEPTIDVLDELLLDEWPELIVEYDVHVVPYETDLGFVEKHDGGHWRSRITGTVRRRGGRWVAVVRHLRVGRSRASDAEKWGDGPIDSACSSALVHEVLSHIVPRYLKLGDNADHMLGQRGIPRELANQGLLTIADRLRHLEADLVCP